jgi:hypothetical protein
VGREVNKAADFLIRELAGREKPSREVNQLAQEFGISKRTLNRAKHLVNAKCRKGGGEDSRWFISVPEEMTGRIFCAERPAFAGLSQRRSQSGQIAADWVMAKADDDDSAHKIDIPACNPAHAGVHIKVGGYEIKADGEFSSEKLAELLLALGGEASR